MSQPPDDYPSLPSDQDQERRGRIAPPLPGTLLTRPPSRISGSSKSASSWARSSSSSSPFGMLTIVPKPPPVMPVQRPAHAAPPNFTIISKRPTTEPPPSTARPAARLRPLTVTLRGQLPVPSSTRLVPAFTCRFPAPDPGTPFLDSLHNPLSTATQQAEMLDLAFMLADPPPTQQQQIIALIPQVVTAEKPSACPPQP